jgi:hypothetical protein
MRHRGLPPKQQAMLRRTRVRGVDDSLPPGRFLRSPIPEASDEAWTALVCALKTADLRSVSKSNALGMFELRPKRLADLDIVMNLCPTRLPSGRMGWVCDFIPPMTAADFLASAAVQLDTLERSLVDYVTQIRAGLIDAPIGTDDMTLSGALAVLHRCGPHGLKAWYEGRRFPDTEQLYKAANGVF